jgi:RNA 3'-terminal phosphate cyclase (ATP)
MAQHLTAVNAAMTVSCAEVSGATIGSTELLFFPRVVKAGAYSFDIGTAGSVCLVIQTLLPALLFTGGRSTVRVTGGTHVPWSPSFDYLHDVFLPVLGRIGISVKATIESYGFYPKGGGIVRIDVEPVKKISPLIALTRGKLYSLVGRSVVAGLPVSIAERQTRAFSDALTGMIPGEIVPISISVESVPSRGQGTFMFAKPETTHGAAGFCALGARGKRAEEVGIEAAQLFMGYYDTSAAIDPHLADQIVQYLVLAQGESTYTTSSITDHLRTSLWATSCFLPFESEVIGDSGRHGMINIRTPAQRH